ncbi:MAG: aminodeoxychorismate/anthranilate synthase component II, partial [Candidatus Nanopelagicales bacterium]|nr:aminodeoxychorismate/anthranilate synthase component II [Candidatus Nanopelagicales bacterium]
MRSRAGSEERPDIVEQRVLVVDNYDSFVFNLVQYLAQLGAQVDVLRNDEVDLGAVGGYRGVLLSPGPGGPADAGCCVELIRRWGGRIPILGVCLGHQAIAAAAGGNIVRAPELLHGKTSRVIHDGRGVLEGIPSPFTATRYHSLVVDEAGLPSSLEITARSESGLIMGLRDRARQIEGVQFHPESVLTEHGHRMLANWLAV